MSNRCTSVLVTCQFSSGARSYRAQGYDHVADPVLQSLDSELGLIKAVSLVLRLGKLALLFAGVPCDSFVFISSASHGRNATCPYGLQERPFVEMGNLLTARFALLALLAVSRRALWLAEQPGSSVLLHHPSMQKILLSSELKARMVKWCLTLFHAWQSS